MMLEVADELAGETLYYESMSLLQKSTANTTDRRFQLLSTTLPWLFPIVRKYASRAVHTDFLDLCQIATLEIVEVCLRSTERVFQAASPPAYLLGVGKLAIIRYLESQDALLVNKARGACHSISVLSLDSLLKQDRDETFADTLVAPSTTPIEPIKTPIHYALLYAQIETLTAFQKDVLTRLYGLYGTPSETLSDIDAALTGRRDPKLRVAYGRKQKALRSLYRTLEKE